MLDFEQLFITTVLSQIARIKEVGEWEENEVGRQPKVGYTFQ